MKTLVEHPDRFVNRHLGPRADDLSQMLCCLGYPNMEDFVNTVVPSDIQLGRPLGLPAAQSEAEVLKQLRQIAVKNKVYRSYLGMGYSDCITPPVIQRNILENPGWYTQYTPYQAEISQGRLEGLLNFQTMVCDLTGMDIANASMLDEATAAAEAMMMCHRLQASEGRTRFLVAAECHPQNIEVVKTRAAALDIEVAVVEVDKMVFDARIGGVLVQYPDTHGEVRDLQTLAESVHAAGGLLVVVADLLSLTLLRPPGEFGADIAVGNTQRFGVPLGYGGPHAAFFATKDAFKRQMPGRLVGISKDSRNRPGLRLSLGTREQHIRREKATSNICTAQALLANMAAMYAVYHGPTGLRQIAQRIHQLTQLLASGLKKLGHTVETGVFFDTLRITPQGGVPQLLARADRQGINLRVYSATAVGVALDETCGEDEVETLLAVFAEPNPLPFKLADLYAEATAGFPAAWSRKSVFLTHPVFNRYHSETEMLRYLKRLELKDLSLAQAMIPLGSCTMKLNATAEMIPVSWPEFAKLHPFAPREQAAGYSILFEQLEQWLAEITGFARISLQPNAGSQGEYAGLLVIRDYFLSRGEPQRRICLIPQSAHGTNPASAVMAGMSVVAVACDAQGNIDVADLRQKAEAHRSDLAALMVTYPSTHGVFETAIREICQIIHANGGQVYMDGANMNAQVGLCRPADIGADVCHLNLHKTFAIPHGGGGPGMGPIGVAAHLVAFLPGHPMVAPGNGRLTAPVSAAPWGSASILPISWVYIAAMGAEGLRAATAVAILNANYMAHKLDAYYPVLFKGPGNLVAHECIIDLREFKSVTVEDVAKRLMDFGFHAPTISWPVPGTMMIEPTESESKAELDRFCEAMIAIHAEITAVESGQLDRVNNPLKNAPHTADMLAAENWNRPYTREQAAYPARWLHDFKFWPVVGRIDNVYGDRNLVCSCAGMESFT
jgi:glycine dehydrogenase